MPANLVCIKFGGWGQARGNPPMHGKSEAVCLISQLSLFACGLLRHTMPANAHVPPSVANHVGTHVVHHVGGLLS